MKTNAVLRSLAIGLGWIVSVPGALAGDTSVVSVTLPSETAVLKPGPGLEVAQANCVMCHSVDYIYMQPPLNEAQWRGVVMKMKKVMGAPIADGDVDQVVQYLVSQNGKRD